MPSGCRTSPPAPKPSAIGVAPASAASVVIMIGRNRVAAALRIASRGLAPAWRATTAKSTIMIAFFLTIPTSRINPTKAIDAQRRAGQLQCEQRADARSRQPRQDGQRMNEALVQD